MCIKVYIFTWLKPSRELLKEMRFRYNFSGKIDIQIMKKKTAKVKDRVTRLEIFYVLQCLSR